MSSLAGQSLNGHSPALGERLVRRGVVADIFIVGGAAMALAYDAARVTRDVDAMFKPHGIVHEEAVRVADDLGLPRWWLNEQASTYISGKDDADKRRVFDHPGLRVMAASPRHIFAMKALAARTRDIDDLRLLADIVGVESADAALQICANFYPDEPVSPRSAAVLRELFGRPLQLRASARPRYSPGLNRSPRRAHGIISSGSQSPLADRLL